ncbi:MAG: Npun_F5749 family FMN-dependent PPOX-type flavoprotein [Thermosynechococcaceae cyanobacterium]
MTLLAPWRSVLARALHRNRSLAHARYLQLATLTLAQRPANRTVVFRGFLEASNQLKFVTDARSAKIEQIRDQAWAEACWYFPKTREQFRISGQLACIDEHCADQDLQKQRVLMWQSLSDAAREQFTWPAPGLPVIAQTVAQGVDGKHPVSSFCLLLLEPDRIDHLELRTDPQHRCLYVQDQSEQWVTTSVNP